MLSGLHHLPLHGNILIHELLSAPWGAVYRQSHLQGLVVTAVRPEPCDHNLLLQIGLGCRHVVPQHVYSAEDYSCEGPYLSSHRQCPMCFQGKFPGAAQVSVYSPSAAVQMHPRYLLVCES